MQGDVDRALVDHVEAIRRALSSDIYYAQRGYDYLAKGQHTAALADLSEAIKLDPPTTAIWPAAPAFTSPWATASGPSEDLTAALRLDKADPRHYAGRALVYLKSGKPAYALLDAQRALVLRPDDPELLEARGRSFEALRARDRAIADYRKALADDPSLAASRLGADAPTRGALTFRFPAGVGRYRRG